MQFLYKPQDDLSLKLNFDGANVDENSNTKPFMVDPTTLNDGSVRTTTYTTRLARSYFGGYKPIIGSWDKIELDMAEPADHEQLRRVGWCSTWNAGPVRADLDHRGVAGSTSTPRTTRSRPASRFSRSGTLVDTESAVAGVPVHRRREQQRSTTRPASTSSASTPTRPAGHLTGQRRRRVLRRPTPSTAR